MAVLDHLVYAVDDLEAGRRWFAERTGVVPALGGAHPGRGTHNALVSFGTAYLELIAADPDQPTPDGPRPFGLDDVSGNGLVAFAIRPDDGDTIDKLVDRARAAGYDPGGVLEMSRRRPDGGELAWRLTFPPPTAGGVIPFVIDWGSTDRPSETAPGGLELAGLEILHPDPASIGPPLGALGAAVTVSVGTAPGLSADVRGPNGSVMLRAANSNPE